MRRLFAFAAFAVLASFTVGCGSDLSGTKKSDSDRFVEVESPEQFVVVYDKPGESRTVPIKVRHSLASPAIVTAETGCGCLLVDCPATPLGPAEWLTLNARFSARPEAVRRDVWLKFEAADHAPVERRVPTVIAMYPHLEVDPPALVLESSNGEPTPVAIKVRLRCRNGEPEVAVPRFLGLSDDLKIEKVTLTEREPPEFGVKSQTWLATLRCRPPVDSSREAAEIYVGGALDRPPVRLAVSYVRPQAVLVTPSRHYFGSIPLQEIATCRSIVRRRDGKPFHVSEIRSSHPSFQATVMNGPLEDGGLTLRIRYRPTRTGAESGTILLRTDAPDSPEVSIAVEGSGE
jgi:hypothetical protein